MPDSTRQRLRDLVSLLSKYPDGLTTPEIADELGVTRQTALKDIRRLEDDGYPIYPDGNRHILPGDYHKRIYLSLAQAWFMYLPLRRIVRAELHRFPLVRGLLHRIASLFHEEIADQLVPRGKDATQSDTDQIFSELVHCWREERLVEISYRKLNTDRRTKLVVAPWWFEPAVWSDAFYLICGLQGKNGEYEPLTLKIDRIQSVKQHNTRFRRPPGKEIIQHLEKTWGIWVGKGEAVRVKLRFHNRQLDRLNETRWHLTEETTVDDDGSIIWQASVSEPQEMLPWIRGWGADVEVLEPENIRQQIAAEAETTARLYGRNPDEQPDFF